MSCLDTGERNPEQVLGRVDLGVDRNARLLRPLAKDAARKISVVCCDRGEDVAQRRVGAEQAFGNRLDVEFSVASAVDVDFLNVRNRLEDRLEPVVNEIGELRRGERLRTDRKVDQWLRSAVLIDAWRIEIDAASRRERCRRRSER